MRALISAAGRTGGVMSLWLALLLTAAPAFADKDWNLTSIAFTPGSATTNGYVSAGTALDYQVRHCGAGTIYLVAGIRPNTMQIESRYWYKGKLRDVPAAMLMVQPTKIWIKGRATYGINSANFGGPIPLSDKASCWFDGIGLPPAPKGVKGDDFARTFTVYFERSTTVLRNEAFEKYIDELDAREREAEAARKKQEDEQKRAEAERKKQEAERVAREQREKAEAERKAGEQKQQAGAAAPGSGTGAAAAGAAAATGKSAAGGADFWGDAPAAGAACGEPQYVTSGNRYFRKDCNGRLQEVNMDDYYRHRKDVADRQQASARAERERAAGDALQRLKEEQRARAAETARLEAEVDTRMGGLRGAFAAGARMEESRAAVRDLSRLQASYDSLEALDNDFQQRLGALHDRFDDMRAANRDRVEAGVNAFYGNENRAAGELTGMVALMASDSALEKEKKAAREEMYRQKEQLERSIEAARKARQQALRKELLATFADSQMPLSSQKVATDTVYFFAYATTGDPVAQERPGMTVTSVFPVTRRGDGGWPFKRNFNEELRPLTRGDVAWTGYFGSAAEAEAERRRFLDFARKGGFAVSEVDYRGRAGPGAAPGGTRPAARGSSGGGGAEFWNEGGAPRAPAARNDFW